MSGNDPQELPLPSAEHIASESVTSLNESTADNASRRSKKLRSSLPNSAAPSNAHLDDATAPAPLLPEPTEGKEQQDEKDSDHDSDEELDDMYDKPSLLVEKMAVQQGDPMVDMDFEDQIDAVEDAQLMDELQNTLEYFNDKASTTGGITTDPTFLRLREEYDRLHRMFIQARTNEKRLMKRCRDMSTDISSSAVKVQAALKMSQNDRSLIASLKKEVRKAWKMVETEKEKEAKSKDAMVAMKAELDVIRKQSKALEAQAETPVKPTPETRARTLEYQMQQEESIKELILSKEKLQKQYDSALMELKYIKEELSQVKGQLSSTSEEKSTTDSELLTLKETLATKKSDLDREIRSKDKLENHLRHANEQNSKKDMEIANKSNEIRQLKDQISKMELHLKEEKTKFEKGEKEHDVIATRLARLQQEYDEQVLSISKLLSENQQQGLDLKAWEEELVKQKEEYKTMSRAKEGLAKRVKMLEEIKLTLEIERDQLKNENHSTTHDLDMLRKELDSTHKQLESLKRERDIAQKNYVKATDSTQKQIGVVKLAEQTRRNLEQEINSYKDEATKMRKLIYSLEKERDKQINEQCKSELVIQAKEEEIKLKEMVIFDINKKLQECEKKLKEQQGMYETVRTDRNIYSKNLLEAQDEITEMKRKTKIMGHQIDQLKEEIANKESALVKEHFEHSKLEKEKESLSIQISKLQQQYEEAQKMIKNQLAEENKLRHIISEADAERLRQAKDFDSVVQERDILGTQLIRRNDELSLLYEKVKIQTSTLHKGEIQYRERIEDIRVLKLEIKKLRREKAILQSETQHVDGLRSEIFKLHREILRERTRVKVLEEELESPMNIHRWRKLSGSDPSTYELISKIQTLQKRLIAKTEQVVEKELLIAQKDKLYQQVKQILQRQPGPEIFEELRAVKEAARGKVKECKSLASELNMYHSQVNEYKYEIEKLTKELQDMKRKYYEQKKRDRTEQRKLRQLEDFSKNPSLKPNLPLGPKFVGGGFSVSSGPLQTIHYHAAAPTQTKKDNSAKQNPSQHHYPQQFHHPHSPSMMNPKKLQEAFVAALLKETSNESPDSVPTTTEMI